MNTVQLYDIRMIPEGLQEHDFPESSLRVRLVPEGVEDLLDRDGLAGFSINRLPDDAVCAFSEPFLNVESLHDVVVNFGHFVAVILTFLLHLKKIF